jgi:NADH-quinone oxidoreductase subunit M
MLYERRHTRLIADFGGIASRMPILTAFFAITMFSSIGLPGLNGFIGEFLILVGAFQYNKIFAGIAVIGIILGAAYMLWLFQRVMFGPLDKPENKILSDLNPREIAYMVPLIVLMFWIGLYPKPFIQMIDPAVMGIVKKVNPAAMPSVAASAALKNKPVVE